MTIASTTNKSGPYNGNGATTEFPGAFKISDETHVQVILADEDGVETVQTITTHYTVAGVGGSGFTVTMLVAPPTGSTITLIRDVPFTQEIDLQNQGAYYAETIEEALDAGVARDQQLQEQVDRSVKIPASSALSNLDTLIADITRLATSADEIDTVADIAADVSTVAAIAEDVSAVAALAPDVTALRFRLEREIYPEDYAVDGVVTDASMLAFFTAATGRVGVLRDTYTITTKIDVPDLTDATIRGIDGAKIVGTSGYGVLNFGNLNRVTLADFAVETTVVDSTEDTGRALIYSVNKDVKDVHVERVRFSAPDANTNGLIFYVNTDFGAPATNELDGLWVEDCRFEDIGRIACTIMSRSSDRVAKRVHFNRNYGKNLGLEDDYGFLLSLDGLGDYFEVNHNHVDNALGIGIENVGWCDGTFIGNTFGDAQRIYKAFSFSNTHAMRRLHIEGNRALDMKSGVAFQNVHDSTFIGNVFTNDGTEASSGMGLQLSSNNVIRDCRIISASTTGLQFGASAANSDVAAGNIVEDCYISTETSASQQSTLRFSGSAVTGNRVSGCTIVKGTGGLVMDEANSAERNIVTDYKTATDPAAHSYVVVNCTDADQTLSGVNAIVCWNAMRFNGTLTAGRKITVHKEKFIKPVRIRNTTGQTLTFRVGTTDGDTIANNAYGTLVYDAALGSCRVLS